MQIIFRSLTLLLVSAFALSTTAYGQFDLVFDFGSELSEFTAPQLSIFDQVEAEFESQVLGYQPGVSLSGSVIDVSASFIDGPFDFANGTGFGAGEGGGATGFGSNNGGFTFFAPQTNPTFVGTDGVSSSVSGTFSTGVLTIDEDDLMLLENTGTGTGNGLFSVIYHEVAHALGFGLLWDNNGVVDNDGQYIGALGLQTFQREFDAAAVTVPTDGTNAFNAGHWNEGSILGSDLLSPTLLLGATNPISDTTIATFDDIGYVTVVSTAVPEPSSLMLLASSGILLLGRRRRFA